MNSFDTYMWRIREVLLTFLLLATVSMIVGFIVTVYKVTSSIKNDGEHSIQTAPQFCERFNHG